MSGPSALAPLTTGCEAQHSTAWLCRAGEFACPDATLKWRPFPSAIDGIQQPPFVFAHGTYRGVLYLTVFSPGRAQRAFGIEMRCQAYFGVEDLLYSNVAHSDEAGDYDGSVYIKEAMHSALLTAQAECNPTIHVRHFLFVGGDYCYEVLSSGDPIIRTFDSDAEAVAWASLSRS